MCFTSSYESWWQVGIFSEIKIEIKSDNWYYQSILLALPNEHIFLFIIIWVEVHLIFWEHRLEYSGIILNHATLINYVFFSKWKEMKSRWLLLIELRKLSKETYYCVLPWISSCDKYPSEIFSRTKVIIKSTKNSGVLGKVVFKWDFSLTVPFILTNSMNWTRYGKYYASYLLKGTVPHLPHWED